MKKQFFVAAMALVLGAGFTACSSDDLNVKPGTEVNQKATTYMSVSFELPSANSTRAAADGQDKNDPDFNNVGKWEGKDRIEKVSVYVFNAADKLEVKHDYAFGDLVLTQNPNGAGNAIATPNKAFKVTAGVKTVYVVINPTTESEAKLPSSTTPGAETTLADFKLKYEGVAGKAADNLGTPANQFIDMLSTSTRYDQYTLGITTRADEVAYGATDASGKNHIILMTGKESVLTVEDGVSEQRAINGEKNRANLTVQRAVAKVFLTTREQSFTVKGLDPENPANGQIDIAEISDLRFVVAQGEAEFYFTQNKLSAEANGSMFRTPAFDKVNGTDDYWSTNGLNDYIAVGKHYDYAGLWETNIGSPSPASKGRSIPTGTQWSSNKATELGTVTDLAKVDYGVNILPTLHKFSTDRTQSGYRKGNTAYILVRGILKPKKYVDWNGNFSTTPVTTAKDWYLGANGVIYENKACVQDPAKKGVAGQTAQKYVGGKVLYFIWLNPDNLAKAVNSPVIRNNIYHVQIKGISKIGSNWNPLVPFDPEDPSFPGNTPGSNPNDPSNPTFPKNPNNPDPRPDNDIEPKDPPVDPSDPLTFKETWMSVNVNILPWEVHSYEVEL